MQIRSGLILLLVCGFFSCSGGEKRTLQLSGIPEIILSSHVHERPAPAPKGAKAIVTPKGIELDYVFASSGHDACMVEFPVKEGKFNRITVELTALQAGHRPFIVLTDKNGEKHYFSLIPTPHIRRQVIRRAGRQKLSTPISIKNSHPGEHFAYRWGGDNNQKIDFPIRKIQLGINDHPDESKGSGKLIFHSIMFQ